MTTAEAHFGDPVILQGHHLSTDKADLLSILIHRLFKSLAHSGQLTSRVALLRTAFERLRVLKAPVLTLETYFSLA